MKTNETVDVLNSLLRGEISALETYAQAIKKHAGDLHVPALEAIKLDHHSSSSKLTETITGLGGTPSTESGVWGGFAKLVQGAANLAGEESSISALIQGEEHGQKEYKEALENDDVDTEVKSLISGTLLPKVEKHIAALKLLK